MNAPISSPTQQKAQASTNWPQQSPSTSTNKGFAPPRPQSSKQQQYPNSSATDPFLKDFTLVAEAAKRAQMAVMIRDLEGCGLS